MRRRLQGLWIVTTVTYAFVRIFLASKFLAKYGLRTRWFAAIELPSALLFGFASGRLVGALLDWHAHGRRGWLRGRIVWGTLTAVGFIAPDVYVFASTRHLPRPLFVVLVVFVVASLVLSALSFWRRVSQESHEPGHSA